MGIYNTFKKFKGTDLLSMSVHNDFKQLIALNKYNIIFEGDRLFTNNMLDYINQYYKLVVIVLKVDDKILVKRHKDREDTQNSKFLKGRNTKIANIMSNENLSIMVRDNNNSSDMSHIYNTMVDIIKKKR